MNNTLTEIAQQLKDANRKVQLIYAFNGTGKTRLSREFKQLIAPRTDSVEGDEEVDAPELSRNKILYYNAFTEDLFYWDNDLVGDAEYKLKIQPNSYTSWVLTLLKDLGQDGNIIHYFQRYANDKLTPHFSADFDEVTFSLERGNEEHSPHIKLSKGEESNFIWSVFYTMLDQAVTILNVAEPGERETGAFDQLEYVFIDDPVSSLDENHLIELAVNLASLIKSSESNLRFIVSTHSPLFYNVLYNELNGKTCYMLERCEDGSYVLTEKYGDSNKSFSYHLHLKQTIEQAIADNKVERFHFTLLRNLYEKTASFLGHPKWSELLPDDKQLYLGRVLNFTSHSTLSNEAVAEPTPAEKAMVKLLLDHLKSSHRYWQ
ncbi:AAA family ATPase [Pseudomonas syringae pv. aptata]|uniref:AAA family ATPase n=1 Tax=Pseudomonas syringae pv. maculicola str. ES4326 TaxID=629265 RepID=A0A8T8BV39_PSEYM|nr:MULTISPECIES: AAA family ATPase [Pseudomonas syringae group]MCK0549986.1 AAA family ATPase [Pseudomonas syringae pv. aptata]QHE95272.1 AAA family ATPase [Pseudomonas syringae pv. maculicola str. ES4326]UBY95902.1 AAA family ATPase [Pseudomonas cannabina pv. alisalensis]